MENGKNMDALLSNSLSNAKNCLEGALRSQYPVGYSISSWWSDIQKKNVEMIRNFQSPDEAIRYAQVGHYSGFDHRMTIPLETTRIVNFKLEELKFRFPDFKIENLPNLVESPFSIDQSIVQVENKKLSNIFLSHLYFYLRTTQLGSQTKVLKKVLEIGSGYGALARIYKLLNKEVAYTLVDLPESLFYAQTFLSANFPDARIKYVNDNSQYNTEDYDFILVPVQLCDFLKNKDYDLVINTGSLQEMPDATVRFWMNFIQNTIRTNYFYSWNYFLNNKEIYSETGLEHINLICPILDPYWNVKYFRINDQVLTIDADARNWLEVCVQRLPVTDRTNFNPKERASELFAKANSYRPGTNYWFSNVWMAIWCDPQKAYINTMLEGIDLFAKGKSFGITNNLDNRTHLYPELRHALYFSYRTLRSYLRNFLSQFSSKYKYISYDTRNDYSEIRFYNNLKHKL